MDFKDCIKFANENPLCFLATADGDQPRVRGFLMWFADEKGFYFHTGASKNVGKQLLKNQKVEVCFYAPEPPPSAGRMMRVEGEIEVVNDIETRSRLLKDRPFLNDIVKGKVDNPLLILFRVYKGEAHFWTMENNMREEEIERIRF
jgi:uncharacterized pyridoxamine 5'-phosphate oxidase family protein